MMGRQILPTADVGAPIGHAGSDKIDAGGYLALQGVPVAADVGRPEDGSIVLRSEVGVASQNERALAGVGAHSVVKRRGMDDAVDVEESGSGAHVEKASVGLIDGSRSSCDIARNWKTVSTCRTIRMRSCSATAQVARWRER